MDRVEDLIQDPALRHLLRHHWEKPARLDFNLAREVQAILPKDDFSISQYLLGLDYFRHRIRAVSPKGGTFVDIGCGAGNWSVAAADSFEHVIGMDVHEARLECAKKMAVRHASGKDIRFIKGGTAAFSLPLADGSADHIVCYNVLPLIPISHESVLKELRRVVKKGGRLYLGVTDLGFIFYLISQAWANKSWEYAKMVIRTLLDNFLFFARLRNQPASWMYPRYTKAVASKAGWKVVHVGEECSYGSPGELPIYPARFFGFHFAMEYVLEAQ